MKKMIDYRTVAGLVILAFCATAQAREDTLPASQKVSFDITAPSMVQALIQFTQQSGLQLAFPTKGTDDLPAPQVIGEYTPAAALDQLLKNSGLRYEFANERTVSVHTVDTRSILRSPALSIRLAEGSGGPSPATERGANSSGPDTDSARTYSSSQDLPARPARGIPEILVRGKKTLNTDVQRTRDDARPYVVFEREKIERSDATTLEEFFRKNLTATTTVATNDQISTTLAGSSNIDLGGLGSDETLILIDGRRMAGLNSRGASKQPDINAIPLSAIERIEVLRSTASGIYGGGATGGVINIIMRRDYTGIDSKLSYKDTFDGGGNGRRVDLSGGYGFRDGKANVLVMGSYSDSHSLLVGDRDFVQRGRERVLANAPATFYGSASSIPLGATTNIVSSTGAPLTLKPAYGGQSLGASRTFVPYGYAGPASDNGAGLIANAGKYNFDLANTSQADRGGRRSLLNDPTIKSLAVTFRNEFSPGLGMFLEGAHSETSSSFQQGAGATLSIPVSAAANPFNQPIVIYVPMSGTDELLQTSLKSGRIAGGLTANIHEGWVTGLDYTWSRVSVENPATNFFSNANAVNAVATGVVNAFRDVNIYPADFTSAVFQDAVPGYSSTTTLKDISARVSGPLPLKLAGGAIVFSASLGHRREEVGASTTSNAGASPTTPIRTFFPAQSQSVASAYMELLAPFASSANSMRGIDTLELQVAGRYDRYQTHGATSVGLDANLQPTSSVLTVENSFHSVDPTLALRYKPVKDVMVRASFGTGFLPPNADQIGLGRSFPVTLGTFTALNIRDPLRNNEVLGTAGPVAVTVIGGNPALRPEDSTSRSAGLVLTPRFAPGFRFSLDWTKIKKRDAIVQIPLATPGLVSLLTEAAADRVTRATVASGVGQITALNLSLLNFAASETEAYDAALDYEWMTDNLGTITFSAAGTKLAHSRSQLTPLSTFVENAGVLNTVFGNLKWRATAGLKWDYHNWTTSWNSRYYGSYFLNPEHSVVAAQGGATVPGQIYHDVLVSYKFGAQPGVGIGAGLFSNVVVQAGVTNVLNTKPPFDAQSFTQSYYSSVGDPRLATYYLSVRKSFGGGR